MSKLAQTLLLLSRLDYANLSYQQTEISGMIQDIAQRFDPEGSRLKLSMPPGTFSVYGNNASLVELFTIFIENALKYSPEKSTIHVKLTPEAKYARFTISNKGPGIRADKLPYIFDRFFRADESRTGKGGTGLGLALAKQIIKLHNGTVTVKSTPGKLTKFTVLLPVKKAH
jgi:two-component system sensor histidine kinase CiaH